MSSMSLARAVDARYGELLDTMRGGVPRAVLSTWIAAETGGDRYCVSRDPVLIECGLSQAPIARAAARDADPFDVASAIWLACVEAQDDARKWALHTPEVAVRKRDLLYVVLLDYSVGSGATKHLLAMAEAYRERAATIEGRIRWVGQSIDLSASPHTGYWGRQSGALIAKRIEKKSRWLDRAADLGPFDGASGPMPPPTRPGDAAPFPGALSRCVLDRKASTDDHRAAWMRARAYARARRRAAGAAKAPIIWRVSRFMSRVFRTA